MKKLIVPFLVLAGLCFVGCQSDEDKCKEGDFKACQKLLEQASNDLDKASKDFDKEMEKAQKELDKLQKDFKY